MNGKIPTITRGGERLKAFFFTFDRNCKDCKKTQLSSFVNNKMNETAYIVNCGAAKILQLTKRSDGSSLFAAFRPQSSSSLLHLFVRGV